MFVHPTQAIEIFGNVSTPLRTSAIFDIDVKFYGDRPMGTPPSVELNTRGIAEYSDFGPIERYFSETVQDRSADELLAASTPQRRADQQKSAAAPSAAAAWCRSL